MEAEILLQRDTTDIYAKLVNKIKQLEGITHMIAHNLRGAGSNIQLLSDVLMHKNIEEKGKPTDIEGDIFTTSEAVQYINESSVSLLATLNTLMEVADIQLNETIKKDKCDIRHIVDNIFHQLHGFIHQKHAEIEFHLAVTHISYPEAYMESILYNFINNALKYSKPDVPLKITVSTYIRKGRPVLTVKDNGLGIDLEKYNNRIFKLNQVFHAGYESKGIGLYITKTQVESMGGTIDVKSKVGVGSEFIVAF